MSFAVDLRLFVLLGLVFTPLAGAMAYLITYGEYSHHQLERRRPIVMSLQAAVASMVVLLSLMVLAALLFARWRSQVG